MATHLVHTHLDFAGNEIQFAVIHTGTAPPTTPAPKAGQMYYNTSTNRLNIYTGSAWVPTSINAGTTNLSTTVTATQITVASDTGTNAVLAGATSSNAGLLTAADKVALDTAVHTNDLDPTGWSFVQAAMDVTTAAKQKQLITSQAVKSYVDDQVLLAGAQVFQGGYNATTNTPDIKAAGNSVKKGHQYAVTTAGSFYTASLEVGDLLIANTNTPIALTDWVIVQRNMGSVFDELMAGTYTQAASYTAPAVGDSLKTIIGKLHRGIDTKQNTLTFGLAATNSVRIATGATTLTSGQWAKVGSDGLVGATDADIRTAVGGGAVTLADGSTATTQTASDNSTKVATTAFVKAQGYGPGTVKKIAVTGPSAIAAANTSFDITHSLSSEDIQVQAYVVSSKLPVIMDWKIKDANSITVSVNASTPVNTYKFIIQS